MAPSKQVRLEVENKLNKFRRLRDERFGQVCKGEFAESLGEPNDSDNPEKFWTDFNTKILKVSGSCLRGTPGTSKSFPELQCDSEHHRRESQA